MAEGFRSYDSSNGLRPIIPTPFSPSTSIRQDSFLDVQNNALLKHYYQNYMRLIKQNGVISNQLSIINVQKQQLRQKFEQMRSDDQNKKKRVRRTANQINRNFVCPIPECARSYGSQGSLLQHIKIKHQQFYQSDQYESLLLSRQKKRKEEQVKEESEGDEERR